MGNRLKELRLKQALTQTELSKELDIPQTTLSQYENGKRQPPLVVWNVLANYFSADVGYLQGLTDEKWTNKKAHSAGTENA